MRQTGHRLTADDVWKLPVAPHLRGYELVDGNLIELLPLVLPHGRVLLTIGSELRAFLAEHAIGQVYGNEGFVLRVAGDTERIRVPDVAFVSNATLIAAGGEPESGWPRFAPDLAVEIDSPSNTDEDVHEKVRDYLDGGVKVVWIIHLRSRTVTVYRFDGSARLLREEDVLDGEDVLPGFRTTVKSLLG